MLQTGSEHKNIRGERFHLQQAGRLAGRQTGISGVGSRAEQVTSYRNQCGKVLQRPQASRLCNTSKHRAGDKQVLSCG
jgi:hypothetical protein